MRIISVKATLCYDDAMWIASVEATLCQDLQCGSFQGRRRFAMTMIKKAPEHSLRGRGVRDFQKKHRRRHSKNKHSRLFIAGKTKMALSPDNPISGEKRKGGVSRLILA